MLHFGRIFFFGWVLFGLSTVQAQQFSYKNTPLLTVIDDIEQQTEYRFLYREALISNISVSLDAHGTAIFTHLTTVLASNELGLKIDTEHYQALIYKSGKKVVEKKVHISGFVLDATTGERLPAATISWRANGALKGVSSSPTGTFEITQQITNPSLTLLASFVGYTPKQISLSFEKASDWQDVAIRLEPAPYSGKEIVVNGSNFYTPNDTVLAGLVKVGTFSPLGESNAVRSLQFLPSVSLGSAINDGINIRGSGVDGFQVLLDGQTIYNQSHLFGLLDSMNPDVLKSSGFYYDVTPAQFQAPLGGTLALVTRTGSLNEVRTTSGITNTALSSTFEGPILKGRASWLLSGRMAYMDDINWFNNQELIEFGLDVNRPTEIVKTPALQRLVVRDVQLNEIEVQSTEATFYDTHAKVYYETKNGTQLSISGYLGSDNASQFYTRDQTDQLSLYNTTNKWDNTSVSATISTRIFDDLISITRTGYSKYRSNYQKDDHPYTLTKTINAVRSDTVFIAALALENSVEQFQIHHSFLKELEMGSTEFGLTYTDFDVQYTELNQLRNSFFSRRTSQLAEVFHQLDVSPFLNTQLNIGNRVHYFSNGRFLRWSPRVKMAYQFVENLSVSAGYARNYQFMNRLQFYNITSNDFWIMANEDQPPAYVDSYTSGIYWNAHPLFYIQAEVYYKDFDNLRLHELNLGTLSASYQNYELPILYQNDGVSKGLEIMIKNRYKNILLSSAYTLSSSELRNALINQGEYYYASWDQTHQLSLVSDLEITPGLNIYLSWTYGSGAPYRTSLTDISTENTRMPTYSRLDATISYEASFEKHRIKTTFSVYNLTNRNNMWYTERQPISVITRNQVRQGQAITNVYDLGFQPSFNVRIYF